MFISGRRIYDAMISTTKCYYAILEPLSNTLSAGTSTAEHTHKSVEKIYTVCIRSACVYIMQHMGEQQIYIYAIRVVYLLE